MTKKVINLNDMADMISEKEGKKEEVNIAQIKEVLGVVAQCLYENPELVGKVLALGKARSLGESSEAIL